MFGAGEECPPGRSVAPVSSPEGHDITCRDAPRLVDGPPSWRRPLPWRRSRPSGRCSMLRPGSATNGVGSLGRHRSSDLDTSGHHGKPAGVFAGSRRGTIAGREQCAIGSSSQTRLHTGLRAEFQGTVPHQHAPEHAQAGAHLPNQKIGGPTAPWGQRREQRPGAYPTRHGPAPRSRRPPLRSRTGGATTPSRSAGERRDPWPGRRG